MARVAFVPSARQFSRLGVDGATLALAGVDGWLGSIELLICVDEPGAARAGWRWCRASGEGDLTSPKRNHRLLLCLSLFPPLLALVSQIRGRKV